jgi:glycerate kinase
MRLLIAPDSFKDCLSAMDVALCLGRGFLKISPTTSIRYLPMADGGEGTVESVISATGGRIIRVEVMDPLMRKVPSFFGLTGDGTSAVIEMAAASGLELLSGDERNPWVTSTFGTGQLIGSALDMGCRKIMLGIGGSATNDGGMGMAQALGVAFLDHLGNPVGQGGGALARVAKLVMDRLDERIRDTEIEVACDVTNPLTGPQGASYVYGPQKGADPAMVARLDENLSRLEGLIREQLGMETGSVPGAGAAGGLGAGLMAFLGARLVKGFDMVAKCLNLEKAVGEADLILTGEGKMDTQTRFGKTPYGVAQLALKYRKPVIAVTGQIGEGADDLRQMGFSAIISLMDGPSDLGEAIRNAPVLLERAGERIARQIGIKI